MESTTGARGRRKGNAFLSSLLPRGRSRDQIPFPSLLNPPPPPPTHARDNQVIVLSYSSFQIIVINFTRCDFHPQNSYPILIMVLPQSVYLQTGNRALVKHLIDRRSVTSNYHGSKISEWQQ